MKRLQSFLAALLCVVLFAGNALGQATPGEASFSINLEFNDPTDFGSGGTWTVVGKADERGFAAILLEFFANSLNFDPATGFLTPPEFVVEESGTFDLRLETVQGDFPVPPTYDVGVIGGTYPSTYVDDPRLTLLGANPDLGSFTGGIALVTGTFDPGDIPAWYVDDPTDPLDYENMVRLYTGVGFQATDAVVFTTLRYVAAIPEPASMMLLGIGIVTLTTVRRRR